VVCHYNLELRLIRKMLNRAGIATYLIDGTVRDRDSVIQKFNHAHKGILLAQMACSEGYDVSSCSMMVFYSNSFSYKDRVQMEGRIWRHGQRNKVTYIDLACPDTIDFEVIKNLAAKKDFNLELYANENRVHKK